MASPSCFHKVCEEDVQNVLQSAMPEKKTKKATKYGIKIFKGKCRTISEIVSVRQTNGEPFKVSSLKAIRAAIDR